MGDIFQLGEKLTKVLLAVRSSGNKEKNSSNKLKSKLIQVYCRRFINITELEIQPCEFLDHF